MNKKFWLSLAVLASIFLTSFTLSKTFFSKPVIVGGLVFKMQAYNSTDVRTKGPHGNINRDMGKGGKVTEARIPLTDGTIGWVRWGDISTDKKELAEADKVVGQLAANATVMAEVRTQLQAIIRDLEGDLKSGTATQKDFATRNLPKFRNMLNQVP